MCGRETATVADGTHPQGSHSGWKTWKNGKAFSSQGKVWDFEQTGKVRENHTKYWKILEFEINII